jgi:hypothetical protein
MLKYIVLLGALAFAAPGLAIADEKDPPSLTDLTANDPPADSFRGPIFPPGLGAPPPGCSVVAADPDDRNGPNGDDKFPANTHGNPHCQLQPASR